ncbi:MAG: transglycosylase SLT domain-containing protein [Rhodospirillales bacterium]|nr:transglycosylase SLT domain-containing protein [Rhodospirillales bacterium]
MLFFSPLWLPKYLCNLLFLRNFYNYRRFKATAGPSGIIIALSISGLRYGRGLRRLIVRKQLRIISFCAATLVLTAPGPALAVNIQAVEKTWEICAHQAAKVERQAGIPRNLLSAISKAESGRWDKSRRANVAWPWTVTSGGEGRFFDTKAEALAEVEFLMTEGVRNIDVGCMQVNLHYHGDAFETLAEALDPAANATYAASYLKNLYSTTGDWTEAAGNYHSTTPGRHGPYKDKVLAYWRGLGGTPAAPAAAAAAGAIDNSWVPAQVDHIRMARLNDSFRARAETRAAEQQSVSQTKGGTLRATAAQQLDEWRNAQSRGLGMSHLMAMRRAETELKRKKEMDRLGGSGKAETFALRRTQQLKSWRMRVAGQGDTAYGLNSARLSPAKRSSLSATAMAASAARAGAR